MKKYGIVALAFLFLVSCTKYHVKNEIKDSSVLSKFKSSGILYHLPDSSPMKVALLSRSLSQWMEYHIKVNNLTILPVTDKKLTSSETEFDQFLQMSEDDDFLYYKSLGILTQYLKSNEEALKKLLADNGLDSLIIYEIDPLLSAEMQYNEFSSMIIIVNPDLKVVYMDRQYDHFETNEYDKELMYNHLLDEINSRFLDLMFKLKYIKKK